MANNIRFEHAIRLYLPVASGTVSGDPVLVGTIPGVAVTDRDADGNATVSIAGGVVADVPLASAVVTSAGTALFITSAGVVSATSAANSGVFGAALAAKSSGSAATVPVLLAGPQPLQAS
jgi:predicted RecA/RadA family phage recombinase